MSGIARDRYGRPLPRGRTGERAPTEPPEAELRTVRQAVSRGAALFDAHRFFEAHECFEFAWKAAEVRDEDRLFWKGLTQVAVGCCHAQRENAAGALALLERAESCLSDYPSPHLGIDTGALIDAARQVAAEIRRRGASAKLDFPSFPRTAVR